MLPEIVKIVENSSVRIEKGTLFCDNWVVTSKEVLLYLYDLGCIENNIFPDDINIGDNINLELTISDLCSIGFYDTYETFITKNRYELTTDPYHIYEKGSQDQFIKQYDAIRDFISSIKSIAKHFFNDIEILNVVISNEKQSVVISCDYNQEDVFNINEERIAALSNISSTLLNEDNKEKKNLFVNELIDFVHSKSATKLSTILECIGELQNNCEDAYAFYISGFSSNKLKFEINTKAIEYASKIQTVINEAQTKLIAIPSAFVLAALAMDFDDNNRLLLNTKNIVTILSLFIFAILIQLFLSNQKSILKMIKADVDDFKKNFDNTNIDLLSEKFKFVNKALKTQRNRLCAITWILWAIPSLCCVFLIISQFIK
ncbi:MAG: hypothetical protein IKP45_12085 [Bacteroidales bacterium]|nr:hypothetical protein [Bacteroidales bacterium]